MHNLSRRRLRLERRFLDIYVSFSSGALSAEAWNSVVHHERLLPVLASIIALDEAGAYECRISMTAHTLRNSVMR